MARQNTRFVRETFLCQLREGAYVLRGSSKVNIPFDDFKYGLSRVSIDYLLLSVLTFLTGLHNLKRRLIHDDGNAGAGSSFRKHYYLRPPIKMIPCLPGPLAFSLRFLCFQRFLQMSPKVFEYDLRVYRPGMGKMTEQLNAVPCNISRILNSLLAKSLKPQYPFLKTTATTALRPPRGLSHGDRPFLSKLHLK